MAAILTPASVKALLLPTCCSENDSRASAALQQMFEHVCQNMSLTTCVKTCC